CPIDHSFGMLGDEIIVAGVDRSERDAKLFSARLARDGTSEHTGALRPVSPISQRDVETLVVLIASAALTMILFLMRIGSAGQSVIRIPAGSSLAPTWRRAGAAVIDLAPGLFGVLWLWPMPEGGSTMADLTMAYGPWPPVTVGAIMFVHSTVGEWLFGMTLGKAIAGCRTVSTRTGRRPTLAQAAGRNFVKVACPPLGMVQAMSPGRPEPWGFATVVIMPAREGEGPGERSGGKGDDSSEG
ncbi:MAG: RDD family protein, partial [Phycisphaerales bacterium]|nr:RDD family protein [Phycisphaerales bacterium]